MSLDDEVWNRSRDRMPFSNSTEGEAWQANWCDRCLRDAPFRNGLTNSGCPLLLVAMMGRTPAEWLDQTAADELPRLGDQYHCIEFRPPGGGSGEPKPKPEPPSMDGLFPRPERRVRMFVQPQEQLAEVANR